jgi:hypothetical protein
MRRFRALVLACLLVGPGVLVGHAAATNELSIDRNAATASLQTNATVPDVNDNDNPATDTDGDGFYEDVDGDGFTACDDFEVFAEHANRSTVQNNPDLFDFREDGTVDFLDIGALEEEIGGCDDMAENQTSYQGPIVDGDDPASDTDDDGMYEDINGDGILDSEDPETLQAHLDADIVTVNALLFDFDGDGSVDESDVETLQEMASDSDTADNETLRNDTTFDNTTSNDTTGDSDVNGDSATDSDGDIASENDTTGDTDGSDARTTTTGGNGESAPATTTAGDTTGVTTTDAFERGFFTNNPDSSVPFLSDPLALTLVGIVLSVAGILMELWGG